MRQKDSRYEPSTPQQAKRVIALTKTGKRLSFAEALAKVISDVTGKPAPTPKDASNAPTAQAAKGDS